MNELDKIFQSKLKNQTSEYSDQSWNKIQKRLAKQNSKPRSLPWIWMSLFAILAIGAMYVWINVDEQSNSNDVANRPLVSNIKAKNQSKTSDLNDGGSNGLKASAEILSKKDYVGSTQETNASLLSSSARRTESIQTANSLTNTELGFTITNENQFNDSVFSADIIQPTTDFNQVSNRRNHGRVSNTSDQVIDKSEVLNTNMVFNENKESIALFEELSNEASLVGNTDGIALVTARPIRTIGVSTYTTLHSEMEMGKISLSKSMMDDFRQDCPSFVTDRTGVYLDLYVSHELPFSSLSAKEEELDSYATLRSESEGATYSFSAGARLTLMLPNGLGLKTGLNYSQVNEKFSHIDSESQFSKEVITKIIAADGTEDIDTNFVLIPGTRDIISTNKYRSIDIPIMLSYEWDVRERTYMTVNGGAYLNLLFKETGKILSPSGEIIDIADSSGDKLPIYKNNIGLSLFGSVGLHYRLTGNIDLIAEPNIRVLLKSATLDSHSLNHRWFTGGLITGMRYNF